MTNAISNTSTYYSDLKIAISDLYNIPLKKITKCYNCIGVENFGIFKYGNCIYKITASMKEHLVAQRLIGCNFQNVVNVFDSKKCFISTKNDLNKYFPAYIIKQEQLYRNKNYQSYKKFGFDSLLLDIEQRMPYYVHVLNGILQLASVGIIHKDLHAANTMTDLQGNIKIIDFGISTIKRKNNQQYNNNNNNNNNPIPQYIIKKIIK